MPTIKMSITCRKRRSAKYAKSSLRRIDAAVAAWVAADKARGIRTVHVAIDDAKAMRRYRLRPVNGKVTAAKAKHALDQLEAKLKPDYIVLFGATDIIPAFDVVNPSDT